ncbi:uncharacterized mitochondrial protein AtMg00810-like [Rutidosis leptorrhynchoides]|uniref:uncharacterized mitochondrial protein AtMg00810-like n=1 Tax=Rutidosis leptorrhynchoides TaxID=125765 RepID=UPI003A9943A1
MGNLSYFLGIEVTRNGNDMILSQRKYIHELLGCADLSNAKPVSSPMTTNANLALGDSVTFDNPVQYRQIVGALQYVTLSRPDITFAVNKVCQYMHYPTINHWLAVKRILRYLQGTTNYGLRFIHDSGTVLHDYTDSTYNSLTSFSDADWSGVQSFEIMAIAAVGNNLITYLINDMHFSLSKSANIVTNFIGTVFILI